MRSITCLEAFLCELKLNFQRESRSESTMRFNFFGICCEMAILECATQIANMKRA